MNPQRLIETHLQDMATNKADWLDRCFSPWLKTEILAEIEREPIDDQVEAWLENARECHGLDWNDTEAVATEIEHAWMGEVVRAWQSVYVRISNEMLAKAIDEGAIREMPKRWWDVVMKGRP